MASAAFPGAIQRKVPELIVLDAVILGAGAATSANARHWREGRLALSRLRGAWKGAQLSWPVPAVLRMIPDACPATCGRESGAARRALRPAALPGREGRLARGGGVRGVS